MIDSMPRRKIVSQIFIVIFGLAGFILASSYNYLLFHTLAEGFSIVVAFSIFILTWKTRQFQENGYLEFLGIAYFFIAILDGVHTLAYKGMSSVFPGDDANLATQLWIAARYLESLSFLIAPILLKKQSHFTRLFWGVAVVTALLLVGFFMGLFPECF
ncbi:MAG: MASE3 domain-containing protein, partial [Candidatus Vecturithrix sp.]|nr:MASE3 domain-containing protein [Candidatus Vecturithrix sp.]